MAPFTRKPAPAAATSMVQTIAQVMSVDVVTISPEASLREAAELLAENGISGVPVVAGHRLMGVVSATDIVAFAASAPGVPASRPDLAEWGEPGTDRWREGSEPPGAFFLDLWPDVGADVSERFAAVEGPEWDVLEEHTVDEIMSRAVCSLPLDTPLAVAADYMLRCGVHRVLVMDGERLAGIATSTDFLRAVATGSADTGDGGRGH